MVNIKAQHFPELALINKTPLLEAEHTVKSQSNNKHSIQHNSKLI